MNEPASFRRRFAYDRRATQRTLRALGVAVRAANATGGDTSDRASDPTGRFDLAVARFAHLLGAAHLWVARCRDEDPPCAVWPDWTLEDCERETAPTLRHLETWARSLDETELEREVRYVNSKGEPWRNRVRDIAEHLLLHGAYHRGQIAADIRAAGFPPPYTDFIQAARTGELTDLE